MGMRVQLTPWSSMPLFKHSLPVKTLSLHSAALLWDRFTHTLTHSHRHTHTLTHTDTPIHLGLLPHALMTSMQAHIDLCDLWSSMHLVLQSLPSKGHLPWA